MKHFRRRVLLTVLLAIGFVLVFSWLVALRNYYGISRDASKEKPLTQEAVSDTLKNLRESWTDYEKRITRRYEAETVFASLVLRSVDDREMQAGDQKNSAVVSIENGELSMSASSADALGLDVSLFQGRQGSFAAPNQPSTLVAYSRIGDTSDYFVKWYEDTVLEDEVRKSIDIPVIMKWTEITYGVPAIFVSCSPDSGEISEILYKNESFFSNCESLEDLGLTQEDLEKNDGKNSGTLSYEETGFTYISGKSAVPDGYVILLEPVPNLYAKAFIQAGYMIAALIITLTALLVSGFSLYSYVQNNILTPEEEKTYQPSHIKSIAALFGVFGAIMIALFGMFSYALNGMYDDVLRSRERLDTVTDSISMHTERYSQNMQYLQDVYLDYGKLIADVLDTYPQLGETGILNTLAESISASSITLYDANGCETVSSGRWNGLKLGTDPNSTTYDFRRILRGVPYVIHNPEIDEVTGLNEMRLGIQIRDASSGDRYGVMMLCVDISALQNHDIDPEASVRLIVSNLTDPDTTLWIADAGTGRIFVANKEGLEGEDIFSLGLGESDLKGSLMKTLLTEEGEFFVTSTFMETPGILEWTGASEGVIIYCMRPKTSPLFGMLTLALVGCILFIVIYSVLAWMTLSGYTESFFDTYKHVKGAEDPKKKLNPIRRAIAAANPARKGIVAIEVTTAFFLLQIIFIVNSSSPSARNTVYHYIAAGDWERGFNLFAIASILNLLSKTVLLVIGLRLLMAICASFSGAKGKTIFRLLANVILYVTLIFFLIKTFEYLGFSPAAIATAMGSLALAISLGAQNFVADIFAGLTFVFEGTLHVGDNVQIAIPGCPSILGRVVEVGIRCIKILTREGDYVTCCNRDIKTIQNNTPMKSCVICEMVVSSSISADELEQVLKAELPKIGQTDRQILGGPRYNGISSIGNGTMTLSVSAECNEEDYFYVRDKLNSSMQRIFREHGYEI